jgi:putative ABC transport system ATP-binding protein
VTPSAAALALVDSRSTLLAPPRSAPAPAAPVLSARGVTKTFREGRVEVEVLRGIDFALAPGEIVALEGPSGSGKTTLLSILGCILTATSGEVTVAGERVEGARPERLAELRKRSIGFVFQQYNLFPALTARDNVAYALRIKGAGRAGARAEADRLLEVVGLSDRSSFLPRDLSGGQKQRVAIARALAGEPPILLTDEPTANLDTVVGRQILELFRDLVRAERRALLIVTHDPAVRPFVDRVVRIRDGRIVPSTDGALHAANASEAPAAPKEIRP